MSENQRYTEAKTAMLLHAPFFSSLLFDIMNVKVGKFPHIFGGRENTAATDGKNIYIDDEFLTSLSLPEAVFLICHEIGHAMWLHMPRAKVFQDLGFEGEEFDARRWNVAGDYVINSMLVEAGIGQMPKKGLLDKKYDSTWVVDDVYRDLKDKLPPCKKITISLGSGSGGGEQDGMQAAADGNEGDTLDVHIYAPAGTNEAEMKRALQSAMDAAKSQGKMPASLERFVSEFLKPQVSWKDKLRTHVARAVTRDATTWRTPHRRRLLTQRVYLPSYTGFGAGKIVVAFDTSGSIGQAELDVFFSELADILDTCRPEKIYLLGADAAVASVAELDQGHDLRASVPEVKGGGGTSFKPVFEWVDKEVDTPAAVIYFTDLYGDFPTEAPGYPVIWCATTDQPVPWGELIRIEIGGRK